MEFQLTSHGRPPLWDEPLVQALTQGSAPVEAPSSSIVIGVEDDAGVLYRVVRTNGINETVRVFESARELGFQIAGGRQSAGVQAHRVLRRVQPLHAQASAI